MKKNKKDLDWPTVFKEVYEEMNGEQDTNQVDDAVFSTKENEIVTKIIRTEIDKHFLKQTNELNDNKMTRRRPCRRPQDCPKIVLS